LRDRGAAHACRSRVWGMMDASRLHNRRVNGIRSILLPLQRHSLRLSLWHSNQRQQKLNKHQHRKQKPGNITLAHSTIQHPSLCVPVNKTTNHSLQNFREFHEQQHPRNKQPLQEQQTHPGFRTRHRVCILTWAGILVASTVCALFRHWSASCDGSFCWWESCPVMQYTDYQVTLFFFPKRSLYRSTLPNASYPSQHSLCAE
jgi:hypothetical protein